MENSIEASERARSIEVLILKLIKDSKIKHYCDSTIFKEKIQDNQKAAEILVKIMEEGVGESSNRAGEMLSMCTITAVPPLLRDLTDKNTQDRLDRLSLSSLIILQSDFDEYKITTEDVYQEVTPHLLPLLDDESVILTEYEEEVEEEYLEYRVCDEAFFILILLSETYLDEEFFQDQDYEQRNAIIRKYKNRFQPLVA